MFGRQAEKMQELAEFHATTMRLLRELKDGTVTVAQITLSESGWVVDAEGDQVFTA